MFPVMLLFSREGIRRLMTRQRAGVDCAGAASGARSARRAVMKNVLIKNVQLRTGKSNIALLKARSTPAT